ncbi:MAG TPA: histidine kinase [Kofleriaceae bacterium]|nr:histidine kinase [Kofleriaceae bacterium]
MPRQPWQRAVRNALALNLVGALAVSLLLTLAQGEVELAGFLRSFAVSLVFSNLIGVPAWLLIDRAVDRFRARGAVVVGAVVMAIVLALTFVACAVAGLFFTAIGWFDPAAYWANFFYMMRIALVVGAICTASGFAWERLHERVDASRVAEARAKELAAEARLMALEARVHPHFLFNSLNSVLSLIPDDPARAEALLEKVAALLRFALDAGQSRLIPLEDELRIVRDYLDIEQARLGDRLRSAIDVEPAALGWKVPPFALQTLVENSVRHSIAPRRTGGAVKVTARRQDGRLELAVWDDGAGFSRAELRAGHGLDNLEGRLASLFDGKGELSLRAGDGGMTVLVAVPP